MYIYMCLNALINKNNEIEKLHLQLKQQLDILLAFTLTDYWLYEDGGMAVTIMTYYDGSNHFEGITDLVKRRKSIKKLTNNLLSK